MRGLFSVLIGFTLGMVVSAQITSSLIHQLLVGALMTLIVYRTQNPVAPLLSLLLSIAGVSMLFELMRAVFVIRMSFFPVVGCVVALTVALALFWHSDNPTPLRWVDVMQTLASSGVIWYFAGRISWNSRDSLITIAATGEDNGSWLDGIARALQRDASLDSSELVLGGSVGSVIASVFVGVGQRSGALTGTAVDVATLTVRSYWMLTAVAALVSARLAYRLSQPFIDRFAAIPSVLAALATILYANGMHVVGHFTALLAATFMTAALSLLAERPFRSGVTGVLSIVAVWSIASAWFPLHALMLLVGVASVVVWLSSKTNRRSMRFRLVGVSKHLKIDLKKPSSVVQIIVVVSFVLFARFVIWPITRLFMDVDYVQFALGLPGAHAAVSTYVVLLTFVLSSAFLGIASNGSVTSRGLSTVAYSMIGLAVALLVYGFSQAPFEPQYGAYKTLHLVCMALVPLALAGLTSVLHRTFASKIHTAIAVAFLVLASSVTFWEPYAQVKPLLTRPDAAWWVNGALKELSDNPSRTILCLDTRKENWRGFDAYFCTRQVAGIQGTWSSETGLWTAANICYVTSEQISSIPEEFWSNVTILVTDPNRLVNSDNCDTFGWAGPSGEFNEKYPIGWLSGVPWKSIRVIGPDGREVTKSFEYLRGDFGYPDEVIDELERSLRP